MAKLCPLSSEPVVLKTKQESRVSKARLRNPNRMRRQQVIAEIMKPKLRRQKLDSAS